MKMSCVLTDNIQRGYSLHESLARGESSYMKGARPHFCLLISIQKGRRSAQHNSLPPTASFAACSPARNRAYWACLKFKQNSKPSLSSPIRASLSCVWPHSLHKVESRQMSV